MSFKDITEVVVGKVIRRYGQDWVIVGYNEGFDMFYGRQLGRNFVCLVPVMPE